MAAGNPLHQPSGDGSGLEANTKRLDPPLLPYEKDLIQVLGCSEAEYKKLIRFNNLLERTRPAAYDHIPDVVNSPTVAIIVNLVVGLALTAAAVLLTPKPQIDDQQERKKVRQEQLPNDVGPSRFNQTSSFDGYASLVEYGVPVPIPFGKMGTSGDGALSGGLVLAASLVWSRAYSYGTYQRVKLLYTLGEHILPAPQVRGVWLGTQSLSALGGAEYALYWKSQKGENRIKMPNRIGGTQGQPSDGDPETQDETFIAPVDGTIEGPGFCMVNNPLSKAVFGQFNPVRNGTAHRLNWEVISIPFDPLKEDPNRDIATDNVDPDAVRRARAERIKIAGEFAGIIFDPGLGGQPGLGRAYGTQMGLVGYKNPGGQMQDVQDKIPFLDVYPALNGNPATEIKFRINGDNFEALDVTEYVYVMDGKPVDYGISHKDLTSSMDTRRTRADDLFVVGSRWMIGSTQWLVTSRTSEIWRPKANQQLPTIVEVILKCVSTTGVNKIGIAGLRASTEQLGGYEGPWNTVYAGPKPDFVNALGFNSKKHCGAAFWNLVQYEIATARMTRLCDTIEFGIKSVVWNQANGLCSFNAIPKPQDLYKKDEDSIQVNTPTTSRYFPRTSCFSVWVRPIPQWNDVEQSPPDWSRINQVFCVTGESPREMFNYLRIRPRVSGLYEFRFIPRTGSDIAINSWEDAQFWELNASGELIGEDFVTAYGAFRVTVNGRKVSRGAVLISEEMVSDPGVISRTPDEDVTIPTQISNIGWARSSDRWYKNAFLTHFLGDARSYGNGRTRAVTHIHFKPRGAGPEDDGRIAVTIQATVNTTSGPLHQQNFGTSLNWAGNGSGIVFGVSRSGTSGQWANGDQFQINADIQPSNPYYPWNPGTVGAIFQVTNVTSDTIIGDIIFPDDERAFELATQVSDCSHYDEITKSCDSGPEHEIVYINSAVSEADGEGDGIPQYTDLTMLGMSLKSGPSIGAIEQPRVWVNGGIGVDRLEAGVYGISNLLSDLLYYLLTNESQGVGELIPPELVDRSSFEATGKYLLENKIFWNGVVEADQNFRSFATEQAQKALCIFTIKNGVFGMMPALPVDSSQGISSAPIPVDGMFTAANIITGSYKLNFIGAEERRSSALQVRWRRTVPYELPEERTALVQFAGTSPEAIEDYDLTQFCDNDYQALMTARYALASRKFIDHTVEFKTTPEAVGVQPGSFIKVFTEETEFQTGLALKINDDLSITSPVAIEDGFYRVSAYLPGAEEVIETDILIKEGFVQQPEMRGALASIFNVSSNQKVYQVSEITLDEDGLVSIVASVVPTQNDDSSTIAYYTMNPNEFEVKQ